MFSRNARLNSNPSTTKYLRILPPGQMPVPIIPATQEADYQKD
jgi:hypothetical protein